MPRPDAERVKHTPTPGPLAVNADLLAALKGVLSHPNFPACNCGFPECTTAVARAAVAKATGEAPRQSRGQRFSLCGNDD